MNTAPGGRKLKIYYSFVSKLDFPVWGAKSSSQSELL